MRVRRCPTGRISTLASAGWVTGPLLIGPMLARPMAPDAAELELARLAQRFPPAISARLLRLFEPESARFRIPVAALLIFIGTFGVFLPPLGFIPLGIVLLAFDVPQFRPALIRMLVWTNGCADAAADRLYSRRQFELGGLTRWFWATAARLAGSHRRFFRFPVLTRTRTPPGPLR
jgi:hypothetical protein